MDKLIPRFIKCRKHFTTPEYIIGTMLIKFNNTNLDWIHDKTYNQIKIYYKTKLISLDNDALIFSYEIKNDLLHLEKIDKYSTNLLEPRHVLSNLFDFEKHSTDIVNSTDCLCCRHLDDRYNTCSHYIIHKAKLNMDIDSYKKDTLIDIIIICKDSSLLFIEEDVYPLYLDITNVNKYKVNEILSNTNLYFDVINMISDKLLPEYNGDKLVTTLFQSISSQHYSYYYYDNYEIFVFVKSKFKKPIMDFVEFDSCKVDFKTSRIQFKVGDKTFLASFFLHYYTFKDKLV